jgi:transglutaminase-like putative cysteine protease
MTDWVAAEADQGAPPLLEPASRLYSVTHTTSYTYSAPVYESAHAFRLRPVHDRFQEVLDHQLLVSVPGRSRELEDVFGNHAVHYEISQPYTELIIEAKSTVRVHAGAGLAGPSPLPEASIPIPWMPWQSQMMMPYLLPPELEQSQLYELSDFARTFVYRNGHNLVASLLDMTRSLFQEIEYVPGATMLETTPFEVYRGRQGVCQDFANLLICLSRLERVPARYRVGYLHTGGNYENKIQAEASHAWVEVYLPSQGWKGLDPTNGVPVMLDHIRVAGGRNYRDATPTSGVIKVGGGDETLNVSVRVEVLEGA